MKHGWWHVQTGCETLCTMFHKGPMVWHLSELQFTPGGIQLPRFLIFLNRCLSRLTSQMWNPRLNLCWFMEFWSSQRTWESIRTSSVRNDDPLWWISRMTSWMGSPFETPCSWYHFTRECIFPGAVCTPWQWICGWKTHLTTTCYALDRMVEQRVVASWIHPIIIIFYNFHVAKVMHFTWWFSHGVHKRWTCLIPTQQ